MKFFLLLLAPLMVQAQALPDIYGDRVFHAGADFSQTTFQAPRSVSALPTVCTKLWEQVVVTANNTPYIVFNTNPTPPTCTWASTSAPPPNAPGSNNQILYNNAGVIAGASGLSYGAGGALGINTTAPFTHMASYLKYSIDPTATSQPGFQSGQTITFSSGATATVVEGRGVVGTSSTDGHLYNLGFLYIYNITGTVGGTFTDGTSSVICTVVSVTPPPTLTAGTDSLGDLNVNSDILYMRGSPIISTTRPTNSVGRNLFVGYGAGNLTMGDGSSTNGAYNTAVGSYTFTQNTTGWANTAMGVNCMFSSTTASENVCMGMDNMQLLRTGNQNTAIGRRSLSAITTGSANTGIGYGTCAGVESGSNNQCLGSVSGWSVTTGSHNLMLATGLYLTNASPGVITGSGNVLIGDMTGLDPALTNNIVMADGAGNIRLKIDANGDSVAGGSVTASNTGHLGVSVFGKTFDTVTAQGGRNMLYSGLDIPNVASPNPAVDRNYNSFKSVVHLTGLGTTATWTDFHAGGINSTVYMTPTATEKLVCASECDTSLIAGIRAFVFTESPGDVDSATAYDARVQMQSNFPSGNYGRVVHYNSAKPEPRCNNCTWNVFADFMAAGGAVNASFGIRINTGYGLYLGSMANRARKAWAIYSVDSPNYFGGTIQAAGNLGTPVSSTAPCDAGQWLDDTNYHYVCVSTNLWRRTALSAF